MSDVNDLLARLRMPSASGSPGARDNPSLHQPNPLASPPPSGEAQQRPPNEFTFSYNRSSSFNAQTEDRGASDRSTNLLNLLKFNRPTESSPLNLPSGSQALASHARTASASASPIPLPTTDSTAAAPKETKQPAYENSLLRLINQAQPSNTTQSVELSAIKEPSNTFPDTSIPDTNKENSKPAPSLEAPEAKKTPSAVFTYVNPFDQLAASSPVNRKKKSPVSILGRNGQATVESGRNSSSPAPSPLPDGRTRVEAIMGIGAQPQQNETVSEALDQIGPQADKDAREAVARAEGHDKADFESISRVVSEMEQVGLEDAKDAVRSAAADMKNDLKDPWNRKTLEEMMPEPAASAFRETIADIASEEQAKATEAPLGADEGTSRQVEEDTDLETFQFPMRPFSAIDIKPGHESTRNISADLLMKIASLKREFDQVDRTLASATVNFIVYAMLTSKGGGFRVVRQDEGKNKHVFKKLGSSVFNLSLAGSKNRLPGTAEPVLATDVNGSVYWTSIPRTEPEEFADNDLESRGFIFPPLPSQDDNTSGAQLKTRAKLSSRHPEFFAVGRGKSIHIIWPQVAIHADAGYIDPKTRTVNSEKYLTEQCLKIATGKAGKDFTFSEDDTVIASLDKAGRLKFWDIRNHVDASNGVFQKGVRRHEEVKNPLMTLLTCAPSEKSWATSVQFLDKERPTSKGYAMRYMLVGSNQNHTLHLWDLGLGKPVQEVNFPHANELDAICSVVYHAKSGVLVVGHPTRNSIYFINISAPRHELSSSLSQAEYVSLLADKDGSLPKPDSTAIMSGMTEVSLSSIGQLRSLDINPVPSAAAPTKDTLFELYIMHSQGVTCLHVTLKAIGCKKDGKPLNPQDALKAGRISLGEWTLPPSTEETHASESGSRPDISSKNHSKEHNKDPRAAFTQPSSKPKPVSSPPKSPLPEPASMPSKKELQSSKEGKEGQTTRDSISVSFAQMAQRGANAAASDSARAQASKLSAVPGPSQAVEKSSGAPEVGASSGDIIGLRGGTYSPDLEGAISTTITNNLSTFLAKTLADQLDNLYRRFDDDKRVQEAAGAAKQDAVLRLVSSTLTDNVEKSLTRIITTNIQDSVVPSITSAATATLDRKVGEGLSQQLQATVPRELRSLLPSAVSKAIQDPQNLRSISEIVSTKVANHVEQVISASMHNSITPAIEKLSSEAFQRVAFDMQSRVTQQLEQFELQRRNDLAKIDQLTALSSELLTTVRAMADRQVVMQDEIKQLQTQLTTSNQASVNTMGSIPAEPPAAPRDTELDEIAGMMTTGRVEEGTIKWLQSARQAELFDKLFIQMSPSYLRSCDQIVTLSVSAAVTASLDKHTPERLAWLETALSSIDPKNPDIADHAPAVMDHLTARLQEVYMQIAEEKPSDPILHKIHTLARQVRESKRMMVQ